jgi:hypothetical protein
MTEWLQVGDVIQPSLNKRHNVVRDKFATEPCKFAFSFPATNTSESELAFQRQPFCFCPASVIFSTDGFWMPAPSCTTVRTSLFGIGVVPRRVIAFLAKPSRQLRLVLTWFEPFTSAHEWSFCFSNAYCILPKEAATRARMTATKVAGRNTGQVAARATTFPNCFALFIFTDKTQYGQPSEYLTSES